MKKLSDRSKKVLAVAGISAACVALIVGISYRFSVEGAQSTDTMTPSSSAAGGVMVAAIETDSGDTQSTSSVSSEPASSQAASSSKADQVIQPDVSKSAAPSSKPQAQGSTSDPAKKPTYSSKDTTPSSSSEPSGGETKDGKVYLPGFGWVTNTGGSGRTASDMYENGSKVGKMD